MEPLAHRPDDAHGGGRRADAERVRGPRRARSVLAARRRAWTTSRRCAGGVKGLRVAWTADLGFAEVGGSRGEGGVREGGAAVPRAGLSRGGGPPRLAVAAGGVARPSSAAASPRAWRPRCAERRDDIDAGLASRSSSETLKLEPPPSYVQAWFDRLAWEEHPRRLFEKLRPAADARPSRAPPFKVGLDNPDRDRGHATVEPYDWIPFTYPFNMTGHPGASVPVRVHEGRAADRAADRGPALRGRHRAARLGRVREDRALGASAAADAELARAASLLPCHGRRGTARRTPPGLAPKGRPLCVGRLAPPS